MDINQILEIVGDVRFEYNDCLSGITFAYGYHEGRIHVGLCFYYRVTGEVVYKDSLSYEYLSSVSERTVRRDVSTLFRGLIKRAMSVELNRMFGGNFNPL